MDRYLSLFNDTASNTNYSTMDGRVILNYELGKELNIFNHNSTILKSRSEWKDQVSRMEDTQIRKKMLTCNPKTRKNSQDGWTNILFKRKWPNS
jgi:hypothetical protein